MTKLQGNLSGIRNSQIEQIETLYEYPVGSDEFLPPDFARILAEHSASINREISVYISRSGEILDITIGYIDNVPLEALSLRRSLERLSMVRCIHTHPGGNAMLSDVDLTALKTLRLDAMCAIGVDEQGQVNGVSAGFLGERVGGMPQPWVTAIYPLDKVSQQDWLDQIKISERAVLQGEEKLGEGPERALLVSVDSDRSLDELEALCLSAGAMVVGRFLQQKSRPDTATYVGSGKAGEIALDAQALEADILVVDDELTSMQASRLEELVGIRVVDRPTLILDIFAQNAVTSEGKLQVELAQLSYRSRHLKGQGQAMSRLLGGIGVRGPGESKLEMDRRHIRERINHLKSELSKMERQRGIRRKGRERNAVPVVALVGYTNSGKSTLLNRLTGSNVLVKDQLFATLDAVNRKLELPDGDSFVLVDTVGFINKLPTELIEAFHSTLEEATLADILLIVTDASSPEFERQHAVVEEVLAKLEADHQPRIEVLNKCDIAPQAAMDSMPNAYCVSAVTGKGLESLLDEIARQLRVRERPYQFFVSFSDYALLSDLRKQGRLIDEEHKEQGSVVKVMLDQAAFGRLLAKYGSSLEEYEENA
ncbi:MAG: GTPase HflX [Clostridiales bacterium]|nr:GTPase HflX [Clostridiales bacterium]